MGTSRRPPDLHFLRLYELFEIALQGWKENLPTRPETPDDYNNIRLQRLQIHEMKAEADKLYKAAAPPRPMCDDY